ncbi:MAG: GDSL-type esterase/lipase family protein [Bryobacteraceae bacterium]
MTCSKAVAILLILASIVASTDLASAQIVALGHSAVRGHVAEKEMWPAVLESMLRARGSRVHVINAGVNGETTAEELARVDSAVPDGTRIVILAINGANDARRNIAGAAAAPANITAIKSKLRARHIRIIDAMALYISVLRQPGMALPDKRHLNAEGCQKVAAALAGMLR